MRDTGRGWNWKRSEGDNQKASAICTGFRRGHEDEPGQGHGNGRGGRAGTAQQGAIKRE